MTVFTMDDVRTGNEYRSPEYQAALDQAGSAFERRMQIAHLIEALSKIIDPDFDISVTLKRKPIPTYVGPTTDYIAAGGGFVKAETITNFVAEDGAIPTFADTAEWRYSDPGIVLCSDPEVR